jgi:hypothetical protein
MKTPLKQLLIRSGMGACIVFFMVLAWASKSDPEANKKRSEAVHEYYSLLGKIHKNVNEKLAAGLQPFNLDSSLRSTVVGNEYQIQIPSVYYPVLNRFVSQDTSEWSKKFEPWGWLSSPYIKWLSNVDIPHFYRYDDVEYRIKEARKGKLLAIIAASEEINMPVLSNDKSEFTKGYFSGWLFLADQKDGSIVGAYPLHVESSEVVEFRTGGRRLAKFFNENPQEAIKADFQDRFQETVNGVLPPGLNIPLEGGSLL